jgi:hypothetical protein
LSGSTELFPTSVFHRPPVSVLHLLALASSFDHCEQPIFKQQNNRCAQPFLTVIQLLTTSHACKTAFFSPFPRLGLLTRPSFILLKWITDLSSLLFSDPLRNNSPWHHNQETIHLSSEIPATSITI